MIDFHPRKLTEKLTSAFLQVNTKGGAQLLKMLFDPGSTFTTLQEDLLILSFYA